MALRTEVAAVFAQRTMAEWTARFEDVDACVTPVLRPDEASAHPLFAAAG
jgi:alpha-methylacyl-CoA racemase